MSIASSLRSVPVAILLVLSAGLAAAPRAQSEAARRAPAEPAPAAPVLVPRTADLAMPRAAVPTDADHAHPPGEVCGTPELTAEEVLDIERRTAARLAGRSGLRTSGVRVPVVFHVITNTAGAGNVTDLQIAQQLDQLNERFTGTPYSFVLAGVDRRTSNAWYSAIAYDANNLAMLNTIAVDPATTLNVYVRRPRISSTDERLGYATFPSSWPESDTRHGLTLAASTFPGGSQAGTFDTDVHELGHYFGLFHTFQGGCAAPGDAVDDTPAEFYPSSAVAQCPAPRDTCPTEPGTDPLDNYMNYTAPACAVRFTEGQYARMDAQTTAFRPSLGGVATGAPFTSVQSGAWGSPSTWAAGVVPGAGDDVRIASGHTVIVYGTAEAGTLAVEAGGTLENAPGFASGVRVHEVSPGQPGDYSPGAYQVYNQGAIRRHAAGGTFQVEVVGNVANFGTWSPTQTAFTGAAGQFLLLGGADDASDPLGWRHDGDILGGLSYVTEPANTLYSDLPLAFETLHLQGARLRFTDNPTTSGPDGPPSLIIEGSLNGGGGRVENFDHLRLAAGAFAQSVALDDESGISLWGPGELRYDVTLPQGGSIRDEMTLADIDVPAGLTDGGVVHHRRTLTGGTVAFRQASVAGGSGVLTVTYRSATPADFPTALNATWTLAPQSGFTPLATLALDYGWATLAGVVESELGVYWRLGSAYPWTRLDPATVSVDVVSRRVTVVGAPHGGEFALTDWGPEMTNVSQSTGSGLWTDAGTWRRGQVPDADQDVTIRSGHTVEFITATTGRVTVEAGATLRGAYGTTRTLTVTGAFVNRGAVTPHPSGYESEVRLGGDVANEGTWSPHRTYLVGTAAQTLALGAGAVFGGEWHDQEAASAIVAATDLRWSGTFRIGGSRLEMGARRLMLTGSGPAFSGWNGTADPDAYGRLVFAAGGVFEVPHGHWRDTERLVVDGPVTLVGNMEIGADVRFAGDVTVAEGAVLQGLYGATREIRVAGRLTNHGTVRPHPSGYETHVYVGGDLLHTGVWAPHRTYLDGAGVQTIARDSSAVFGGGDWTEMTPATPLVAGSDLQWDASVRLQGGRLEMGAHRLVLGGVGTAFSGWAGSTDPATYARLVFASGGVLEIRPGTWRDVERLVVEGPVTLVGHHEIGADVQFAGDVTLAPGGLLQGLYGAHRTVVFGGNLTTHGRVRAHPSGYETHIAVAGHLTVNDDWSVHSTSLTGPTLQTLAIADSVTAYGTWHLAPTSGPGATRPVTAGSGLRFGDRVDLNHTTLAMGGHTLTLADDAVLVGRLADASAGLPKGVLSAAGGTLAMPNGSLADVRVTGAVTMTGTVRLHYNVEFDGPATLEAGATLLGEYGAHRTVTFHGGLVNRGTIRSHPSGYDTYLVLHGDASSSGTWTPTETRLAGTAAQALGLGPDARFGGRWYDLDPASAIVAQTDLHWDWQFEARGSRIEMGAHDLTLSGDTYFSGHRDAATPRNTIAMAGGTLTLSGGRALYHTTIEGAYTLDGIHEIGDGVVLAGEATVAPTGDLLAEFGAHRTLIVTGNLVNGGTVRRHPSGYEFYVHTAGHVASTSVWDVTRTHLLASPVPRVLTAPGIGGVITTDASPVYIAGQSVLPRLSLTGGADVRVLAGHDLHLLENGNQPTVGAGATFARDAPPVVTRAVPAADADLTFVRAVVRASSAGGLTGLTVSTASARRVPGFYNAEPVAWTLAPTGAPAPATQIVLHAPASGAPARPDAARVGARPLAVPVGSAGDAAPALAPDDALTTALRVWHSTDGGDSWTDLGGTHDAATRTVTLANAPTAGMLALATAPPDNPLLLVAPAGGETWRHGETHVVTWTSTPSVSTVEIVLVEPDAPLTDAPTAKAGASGVGGPDARSAEVVLATVPAESASWAWTLPASLPTGDGYRIAVRSATDPEIADQSAPFAVRGVPVPYAVSSPAAGVTFQPGEPVRVQWTGPGVPGGAGDGVVVSLRHGDGPFVEIGRVANTGSGLVRLPTDTPSGTLYQIRVTRRVAHSDTLGESARFKVGGAGAGPLFSLASQTLVRGGRATLTWDAAAAGCTDVDLVLTDRRGRERALAAPNTGTLAWTVPADARAGRHAVEVRCGGEAVATAPPVVVAALAPVAPAAGARWTPGERQTVTWTGPTLPPDGTVRLELRRPGVPAVVLADGLRHGDGEAPVVVPDVAAAPDWRVVVVYRRGERTLTVAGAPMTIAGSSSSASDAPAGEGPWTALDVTGADDADETVVYAGDVRVATAAVEGGAATAWVPSAVDGVAVAEGAPLTLRVRRADGTEAPLTVASVTSGRDGEALHAPEASPDDVLAVVAARAEAPSALALSAPWPNPTPGAAVVRLALPEASAVWLRMYDVRGRRVATLLDGARLDAGWHEARVDVSALAAGVYVLRLDAGASSVTQRLTVVR